MDGQPPNSADSSQQTFASLLKDKDFAALHNAFLLGWSITELKSRVQIAACTQQQVASTANEPTRPQTQSIDALIKDIILADLVDITREDLTNQVNRSLNMPLNNNALPTDLGDQGWLTSVLRAIFNRIVTLHLSRFPDGSTANTIYDLPLPQDPTYPYPFLHPVEWNLVASSRDDYTNIGIAPLTKNPAPSNPTIDINAYTQNFMLYDVTRRALNGLTLLLTTPADSLVPELLNRLQLALTNAVFNMYYAANPPQNRQAAVLKTLSDVIVSLLEAWDSFIRESFYLSVAETEGAETGSVASGTELELTAYDAGRSLANLSWGASVILAPLESIFPVGQQNAAPQKLDQKARETWLNVFNDRDINHVQYQMMALSTALDDAYYRVNKTIKPRAVHDPTVPPDPNLPSQAIQTMVQSLDYWQRAIQRMCSESAELKPRQAPIPPRMTWPQIQAQSATSAQTQAAAAPAGQSPKSNPPQTAIGSNNPAPNVSQLALLDWQMSATLRIELIQQSYVWQSLLLCQQGLDSFSVDKITHKIIDEFMADLEKIVQREIRRTTFMWVLFGALVVIIAILIWLAATYAHISLGSLIPVASITAVGALVAPFVNGLKSRLGKLGSYFGAAGASIEQAIEHGYDQVLVEFGYLNHTIGITYPLVEFFVWEEIAFGPKTNPIQDGYDCLLQVFWTNEDRQAEIQRVVRAAFGPLGAFIGAQTHLPSASQKTRRQPPKQQGQLPPPTKPLQAPKAPFMRL